MAKFGPIGTGPGQLCFPESFTIADNNVMYITEHHNYCVSVFTTDSKYVQKIGKEVKGDGQFDWPHETALDHLRSLLYICHYFNNRLIVYSISCFEL